MLKKIRQIHLYLGVLFAPLLIVLAVSGALQTFRLQDKPKDGGTYEPPQIIVKLADFHKDQKIEAVSGKTRSLPVMWFFVLASIGMIITSVMGIYMAFKFTKRHTFVYLSLAAGVILPILFLLI
jgi:DNA relaxase NicK